MEVGKLLEVNIKIIIQFQKIHYTQVMRMDPRQATEVTMLPKKSNIVAWSMWSSVTSSWSLQ